MSKEKVDFVQYLNSITDRNEFENDLLTIFATIKKLGFIVPECYVNEKKEKIISDMYTFLKDKFATNGILQDIHKMCCLQFYLTEQTIKNRNERRVGDYQCYIKEDEIEICDKYKRPVIVVDNFFTEITFNVTQIDEDFLNSIKATLIDGKVYKVGRIAGISEGFTYSANPQLAKKILDDYIIKYMP